MVGKQEKAYKLIKLEENSFYVSRAIAWSPPLSPAVVRNRTVLTLEHHGFWRWARGTGEFLGDVIGGV